MSWAWILLGWLVGFAMVVLELFMSGIVLGVVGTVLVAASVVAMFVYYGGAAGTGLTAGSVAVGAAVLKIGVSRLVHRHTQSGVTHVGTDDLSHMIGQSGVASTVLRPGGYATIGGKRTDVVTRGEHLEKDTPVVVVAVEGNVVEVRRQDPAS